MNNKRKVVFVENENDLINADSKKVHLEIIGSGKYYTTFYEKYVNLCLQKVCDEE